MLLRHLGLLCLVLCRCSAVSLGREKTSDVWERDGVVRLRRGRLCGDGDQ